MFKDLCLSSGECNDSCLQEKRTYSGGKCRGIMFTCWCITPCATTLLAPVAMAASTNQSGDDGFLNK
ncbi:hypothetical protein BDA96_01G335000 [Sorghum bicolor]|uniref:Knottins-like domain-containing protein n=2 Tax=Sorghum bicolor TaxID=4558 RepID=A0A921S4H8_SORBI|nr:hypothetical protein SORBI_3001G312300 [Sorghum bicolor]KAG0550402.1 hypothetical protein BDA96_01G335000 [Sorghum bicolor]